MFSTRDLEGLKADLAEVTLRYIPRLGARAHDLAHTIVSLVVTAAATSAESSPEAFWRRGAAIVRGYLLDAGVAPERFEAVFGATRPQRAP